MRILLTLTLMTALLACFMTTGALAQGFDEPTLVNALGHTDGPLARALCRRAEIDATFTQDVTPENLDGIQTLIIAVGASERSLASAGVTLAEEIARGEEMIALAEAAGVPILGLHIGGAARRGAISDPLCELVAQSAEALIVRAGGNEDELFTRIATERGVSLIIAESDDEVIGAIGSLFE